MQFFEKKIRNRTVILKNYRTCEANKFNKFIFQIQ